MYTVPTLNNMSYFLSRSSISTPTRSATSTPGTERSLLFGDSVADLVDEEYILVTGGLGYIGSHTSLELLKAGHNVVVVDDLSNSFAAVSDCVVAAAELHYAKHAPNTQCPKLKLWEADYRDASAMRTLLHMHSNGWRSNIKGVIHFAAFKAVEESIKNPLKYYRNNINGLVDFLSLLEEYGIKDFIFSSSATVYGSLADQGLPLREEDCVHRPETYLTSDNLERTAAQGCTGITNPYGRTKFFGEAILSDLAFSDPSWNIIALRYFNPVGCDSSGLLGETPRGAPSNLVPVVTKVMTREWPELSVFGADWNTPDGTAIRDFIHVSDLARGHIAALDKLRQQHSLSSQDPCRRPFIGFTTYNLGTGTGHSVREVIDAMESASNTSIPHKIVARRAGDVGSCVAIAKKANEELCWRTEKSLRDACEDICNFLQTQKTAPVS